MIKWVANIGYRYVLGGMGWITTNPVYVRIQIFYFKQCIFNVHLGIVQFCTWSISWSVINSLTCDILIKCTYIKSILFIGNKLLNFTLTALHL